MYDSNRASYWRGRGVGGGALARRYAAGPRTGRTLYITTCAGCHNLHRPDEYRPERWRPLVSAMAKEAKIDRDRQELIVRYLTTTGARSQAR